MIGAITSAYTPCALLPSALRLQSFAAASSVLLKDLAKAYPVEWIYSERNVQSFALYSAEKA